MRKGTRVEMDFQAWRYLTEREAGLLCRVMRDAAAAQLAEWDKIDAEKKAADA